MIARPCLGCGELIPSGSRCQECKPKPADKRPSAARRGYDYRWRKLSEKARKMQPWCTRCGRKDNLHADHIVPFSEDESLRLCIENIRILCVDCHSGRPPTTNEEREAVYSAVRATKERRARYYLSELEKTAQRSTPATEIGNDVGG